MSFKDMLDEGLFSVQLYYMAADCASQRRARTEFESFLLCLLRQFLHSILGTCLNRPIVHY
jgi:hypothetical protein